MATNTRICAVIWIILPCPFRFWVTGMLCFTLAVCVIWPGESGDDGH